MSETKKYARFVGTGSCIPQEEMPNKAFSIREFYDADGKKTNKSAEEIIQKFREITEIGERRYALKDQVASDVGTLAARDAFESSGIDPETMDYIIVAHNFGDVKFENRKSDMVPSLAARIKRNLGIKNPKTVAFDITFGCPGWVQGVIMADALIRAGNAGRILVVGSETLSRICDPYDRDSLIYADGAGAVILESIESDVPVGILSHAVRSDAVDYADMLKMAVSYNPHYPDDTLFLKMNGTSLYKYALRFVPGVVKESMDYAGIDLRQVSKLLIHQANAKMDYAILQRVGELYGMTEIPKDIMPMTIHKFGNSSVATVPTLLDLLVKGQLKIVPDLDESDCHVVKEGDILVLASVGAGMNINAVVYKIPQKN